MSQAAEYLQAVGGMGASIQAMETVGQLAREGGPLPPDFLTSFVLRCIASCDSAQVPPPPPPPPATSDLRGAR